MSLVEEAVDRAIVGVTASTRIQSDGELRLTAFHEAGHALVALSLPGASAPHKLTIVARGTSGGYCQFVDDHDTSIWTRRVLLDQMATALGGRVAEELVFGEPSSASAADLRRVSSIARQMVREFAMSDVVGPMAYPADGGGPGSEPSPEAADLIDTEIRRLVAEAQGRAREVLASRRPVLDQVAAALLVKETISAAELDELVRAPLATTRRPRAPYPAAVPTPLTGA